MKKKLKKLLLLLGASVLLCASVSICALADEGDPVYVAQVGETKYTDFHEAIRAVPENGTVTLLTDFEAVSGAAGDGSIYMDAGQTKAYKIVGTTKETKLSFTNGFEFWGNTKITFENITIASAGSLKLGNSLSITFGNNAVFTSWDGKTEPQKTNGIILNNTSSLTFDSGSAIKSYYVSDCVLWVNGGTLNINNTSINAIFNGSIVRMTSGKLNVDTLSVINPWCTNDSKGIFHVQGGEAYFTGSISTSGGDMHTRISNRYLYTSDPSYIKTATGLTTIGDDVNSYYSDNTICVTTGETMTKYYNISEAIAHASGSTIEIFKDWSVTAAAGACPLNNKVFTLVGHGKKITLDITSEVWGANTCLTFKDVTVDIKNLVIGDNGRAIFDDGAVLTNGGVQSANVIKSASDASARFTFKSGSKISNVNVTDAVVRVIGGLTIEDNVVAENVVTTSGVIVNSEGTCSVLSNLGASARADRVNGSKQFVHLCSTFLGAVNLVNDGTITLFKDCVYDGGINGAASYILDGNGKTLKIKSCIKIVGASSVTWKNVNVDVSEIADSVATSEEPQIIKDSAVTVYGTSTFTLDNGTVITSPTGETPYTNIVYAADSGITVTMKTGSVIKDLMHPFTEGENIGKGNAIHAININWATLNLNGGEIKNITSYTGIGTTSGCAVYSNGTPTINMTAGEISGCVANGGPAIQMNNGTFNMSGGKITGNSSWEGSGLRANTVTLNISGNAQITGNKRSGAENNVRVNKIFTINVSGNFSGKLGLTKGQSNFADTDVLTTEAKAATIASGATIAKADCIVADNTDLIVYSPDGVNLAFTKKPTLAVTYDSGVYTEESTTYGVVRAMSEFSNTMDNTAIESCGTYFIETSTQPTAGDSAKRTKWSFVPESGVSNDDGFMADCYEIAGATGKSFVAVSWYKLAGIDEYIYTIGAVQTVDTTKTVTYTEA